jgi:hypothetical protein
VNKRMTPERLEELRHIAGSVDGPKSQWMDELIDEVDRLRTIDQRYQFVSQLLDGQQEMVETIRQYRGYVADMQRHSRAAAMETPPQFSDPGIAIIIGHMHKLGEDR